VELSDSTGLDYIITFSVFGVSIITIITSTTNRYFNQTRKTNCIVFKYSFYFVVIVCAGKHRNDAITLFRLKSVPINHYLLISQCTMIANRNSETSHYEDNFAYKYLTCCGSSAKTKITVLTKLFPTRCTNSFFKCSQTYLVRKVHFTCNEPF